MGYLDENRTDPVYKSKKPSEDQQNEPSISLSNYVDGSAVNCNVDSCIRSAVGWGKHIRHIN